MGCSQTFNIGGTTDQVDFTSNFYRKYECFTPGLKCFRGPPVEVKMKNDAHPIHLKARPVPFAHQERVGPPGKLRNPIQDPL